MTAWTLTAKEAPHHPGVKRLRKSVPCQGWMSHKNYPGPRMAGQGGCKKPAWWHFTPIAKSMDFTVSTGDFCFTHLIYTGVCGSMDEEERTRDWLTKYREEKS